MPFHSVRQSRRHLCVALTAALLLAACATNPKANPALHQLREKVAADCAARKFSGVIAVEQRGRKVFQHECGWADAGESRPISPEDRFKIYSTSKTVTAAAILRLVEAGKLRLDDPISTYVPDVPVSWAAVTIRHLLHHQSGIPDFTEKLLQAYLSAGHRSHGAAMGHVLKSLSQRETGLASSPGQTWRYSNFGYELLALIAERIEGRPFSEVVRARVFAPAGMASAAVEMPDPRGDALQGLPERALVAGFNGGPDARSQLTTSYSFIQQGAGAVVATIDDLLALGRALRSRRFLSDATRAGIESEAVIASASARYGYGLMVRSAGACGFWQHSGGRNGYVSEFAVVPGAEATVAILSNFGFAEASAYRQEIVNIVTREAGCHASPAPLGRLNAPASRAASLAPDRHLNNRISPDLLPG